MLQHGGRRRALVRVYLSLIFMIIKFLKVEDIFIIHLLKEQGKHRCEMGKGKEFMMRKNHLSVEMEKRIPLLDVRIFSPPFWNFYQFETAWVCKNWRVKE